MDIDTMVSDIVQEGLRCRAKILIADDQVSALDKMVTAFKANGNGHYEVIPAASGEQAILIAKALRPDGVLMDCDLGAGKTDGIDTLAEIRERYPNDEIVMAVRTDYLWQRDYEARAEQLGLGVRKWWDLLTPAEAILSFFDASVLQPIRYKSQQRVASHLHAAFQRLDSYESFFGDIDALELIGSYEGEVEDIFPIVGADNEEQRGARMVFRKGDRSFVRVFPVERLERIDAAFLLAKVQYRIYALAERNISVLKYVGASTDELLAGPLSYLPDEDLEELDRSYPNQEGLPNQEELKE